MEERRKNPICLHHFGLEEQIRSLCTKIVAVEKLLNVQIQGQRDAINVAKVEMERRLEAMNEFRAQLSTQASTFISRSEMELRMEKLDERNRLTLAPILEKVEAIEKMGLREQGGLTWKNYIITVLIALAVYLAGQFGTDVLRKMTRDRAYESKYEQWQQR